MSGVHVVVLHPELAPRDQTAWSFVDEDDAVAVAGFLNAQLGHDEEIAWVESVPLSRKLSKSVLNYVDAWAEVAREALLDDE